MSETDRDLQWPPAELAVLQNGDSTPSYYRPREAAESLEEFIERIASTVVRGIVSYPHTAFVEIVDGATGETDEAITLLVTEAMQKQRSLRRA